MSTGNLCDRLCFPPIACYVYYMNSILFSHLKYPVLAAAPDSLFPSPAYIISSISLHILIPI